jgi:hypothetical protein
MTKRQRAWSPWLRHMSTPDQLCLHLLMKMSLCYIESVKIGRDYRLHAYAKTIAHVHMRVLVNPMIDQNLKICWAELAFWENLKSFLDTYNKFLVLFPPR